MVLLFTEHLSRRGNSQEPLIQLKGRCSVDSEKRISTLCYQYVSRSNSQGRCSTLEKTLWQCPERDGFNPVTLVTTCYFLKDSEPLLPAAAGTQQNSDML